MSNLLTQAIPTATRTTSPSPDGEAAPTETLARTWKQARRSSDYRRNGNA
ncbi:hypothetical protein [uncultured Nostoc sp.]|nr:hypothetical protein [uncultured Nostoc sp.]